MAEFSVKRLSTGSSQGAIRRWKLRHDFLLSVVFEP